MAEQSKAVVRKARFKIIKADFEEKLSDAIASALPKHLTPARFIRIALTGLSRNQELIDCTKLSLYGCVIQAAQLGLELDGITGQAYLVPFNNSKTGQKECQLIPGYKGLLSLAYNSDKVDSVNAKTVHEGDSFQFNYGLNPDLIHIPKFDAEKRAMTHVYCVVKMKSGGHVFDVMSKEEIDAHRDRYSHASKQKGSVWEKEYDSMAKKTVIRKTLKLVPQSPDLRMAIALDETAEVGMEQKIEADFELLDIEPEDQTEALKEKLAAASKKTQEQSAKSSPKPAKSKDTGKKDEMSGDTTPEVKDSATVKFKGDYGKQAIDLYNQYSALGGDSGTLLDTLTGDRRVITIISEELKHRVIKVFKDEINILTSSMQGKQETLLPENDEF